jgi:hypothetical protein
MVARRSVLLGGLAVLACAALPFAAMAGQVEAWLDTAYKALPEDGRGAVQSVLVRSKLYAGPVDGAWSPELSSALGAFPAHITRTTSDGITVVLDNQADAVRFLHEVSQGLWDPFLFEGWSENGLSND